MWKVWTVKFTQSMTVDEIPKRKKRCILESASKYTLILFTFRKWGTFSSINQWTCETLAEVNFTITAWFLFSEMFLGIIITLMIPINWMNTNYHDKCKIFLAADWLAVMCMCKPHALSRLLSLDLLGISLKFPDIKKKKKLPYDFTNIWLGNLLSGNSKSFFWNVLKKSAVKCKK